jgi:ATP-dependent Lon protease
MPDEEKPEESQLKIPDVLPVLALRDIVVFPFMIVPLFVSRDRSIRSWTSHYRKTAHSLVSRSLEQEEPAAAIFTAGTVPSSCAC